MIHKHTQTYHIARSTSFGVRRNFIYSVFYCSTYILLCWILCITLGILHTRIYINADHIQRCERDREKSTKYYYYTSTAAAIHWVRTNNHHRECNAYINGVAWMYTLWHTFNSEYYTIQHKSFRHWRRRKMHIVNTI